MPLVLPSFVVFANSVTINNSIFRFIVTNIYWSSLFLNLGIQQELHPHLRQHGLLHQDSIKTHLDPKAISAFIY